MKQQTAYSIKRRLWAFLCLILSLTFLFISLGVYSFTAAGEKAVWAERQDEAAKAASEVIEQFVGRVNGALHTLGYLSEDHVNELQELPAYLIEDYPFLLEIVRLNKKGTVSQGAHRDNPVLSSLFTIPQANWFREAKQGKAYISDVLVSSQGTPYMIMSEPADNNNVVAARFRMDILWKIVDELRFGEGGITFVVDQSGRIIAHPDRTRVLQNTSVALREEFVLAKNSANFTWSGSYVNLQGDNVIGTVRPIPGTNWLLIAELQRREALARSHAALVFLSVAGGLFGLIAMLIITRLSQHFVFGPIGRLQEASQSIGQGDLETQIPVVARNEIGQVALAFNDMVIRLRDREEQITQNASLKAELKERERTQAELQKAKEAAEKANLAKSEFLSRMSHELRTPLNATLGFAQLLERDTQFPLEARQEKRVVQILKAGKHLLGLINEILDISRIEAGKLTLSLEPVQVSTIVFETLELVSPLAEKAGITLKTDIPSGIFVIADNQRLKQVLLNLLTNAIKYNQAGGNVRLYCEAHEETKLRLYVKDTGHGIPNEKMRDLFQPFNRLGAEETNIEGVGIGLALSKHLMDAMNGTLNVSSVKGEGSTFWATFPLTTAATPFSNNSESPKDKKTPLTSGVHTFLYIEDNLSNLTVMEDVFEEQPKIQLLTALQGRRGLELAQQHPIDIIILDLHLPDLSGKEVLQQLKKQPCTAGIPVVVLSADATESQINTLMTLGAHSYLTKPLDVDNLLHTLNTLMEVRL